LIQTRKKSAAPGKDRKQHEDEKERKRRRESKVGSWSGITGDKFYGSIQLAEPSARQKKEGDLRMKARACWGAGTGFACAGLKPKRGEGRTTLPELVRDTNCRSEGEEKGEGVRESNEQGKKTAVGK